MRRWRWWGGSALALLAVLGLWTFWLEPASLRVVEHRLEADDWPRAIAGLRIAVLADLHVGSPWNGLDKLHRIVAETNATRPDLVLLVGDYVIRNVLGGTFIPPTDIAPVLNGLDAPLGVFAVLGNHDWYYGAPRSAGALHAAGLR